MSPKKYPLGLLFLVLLTACSTPQSRIDGNRAAFDRFPADAQEKIRTGRVDIGFTPEMVLIALGEPARKATIKNEHGEAEVWSYDDDRPQFSFGFGFGSFGSHSATGVGVATSTGGYGPNEKMRVEFRDGRVHAIEYARR